MKDLRATKQIFCMRIIRDKDKGILKLSQTEYVKKVFSRFSMDNAKLVSTPLRNHFKVNKDQSPKTKQECEYIDKIPYTLAIGSLMYDMVCTRLDIAHAVRVVSRYMSSLGKQHWEAVKWILSYLKGSLETCLSFIAGGLTLEGFIDVDLVGDVDNRKSTTRYIYTLEGTPLSWNFTLQKTMLFQQQKLNMLQF